MKRFFAVALALLLTTGAFAQKRIEKNGVLDSQLSKAIAATIATQAPASIGEATRVLEAYDTFAQAVKGRQYHDFNYIFQVMDEVRVTFMKLQTKSPEAAAQVAKFINRPVAIANGSYFLTLESYLRMETVNLPQSEQMKFDAFYTALVNALNTYDVVTVNNKLPKAYAESVVAFRKFVSSTKELNANWILQSMMNPMDEFNAQLQKNPQLGPAMAKEFVKPIKTSWGTVKPLDIINEYAITLQGPVQDDLFDFRDNLVRLGAK